MNVLALDGALGAFSTAIARNESIAAARHKTGNIALEQGLSLVELVLEAAKLKPAELDRLAVGVGPGSFTGLRIALAYAKSLAGVWKRPLVAVSSFDLLEFGHTFERVLAIVVGRTGVISARYRCGTTTRRASGRIADVLDELLGSFAVPNLDVVGAPKDVLHALAERGIIVRSYEPAVIPAAAAAALMASSATPAKSVHEVSADYGELPAAKQPKF